MGGYGSGRRREKILADDCLAVLDMAAFRDWLRLLKDYEGIAQTYPTGRGFTDELRIELRRNSQGISAQLQYRRGGWAYAVEYVALHPTFPHFGGIRYFWECPSCHKAARKLYLFQQRFYCLRCHRVGYRCQRQGPILRGIVRVQKVERRLGVRTGRMQDGFLPPKPKRMRWATYYRLLDQLGVCQEQCTNIMNDWLTKREEQQRKVLEQWKRLEASGLL